MSGGKKFDNGKVRLELLPWPALIEVGKVLTFGALKYSPWNWSKGMSWSRLVGAAQRHLSAWIHREERDEETGLSHLAHAACCILFLMTYEIFNLGEDDRHGFKRDQDRSSFPEPKL